MLLNHGGKLIISVPCAFAYYSVRFWLTGYEGVNPDHVCYYSPKTLCQLCNRYDLLPISLAFTCRFARTWKSFGLLYSIRDFLLSRIPSMSGAITMQFMNANEVDKKCYFEMS